MNLEGDIGFCHRRHHAAAEADVALSVACQAWHHAVGLFFCWGCRQRAEICGKQRGDRVGREIACDDILPIGGIGYLLRIEAQGVVVVESVEVGAVYAAKVGMGRAIECCADRIGERGFGIVGAVVERCFEVVKPQGENIRVASHALHFKIYKLEQLLDFVNARLSFYHRGIRCECRRQIYFCVAELFIQVARGKRAYAAYVGKCVGIKGVDISAVGQH